MASVGVHLIKDTIRDRPRVQSRACGKKKHGEGPLTFTRPPAHMPLNVAAASGVNGLKHFQVCVNGCPVAMPPTPLAFQAIAFLDILLATPHCSHLQTPLLANPIRCASAFSLIATQIQYKKGKCTLQANLPNVPWSKNPFSAQRFYSTPPAAVQYPSYEMVICAGS